MIRIIELPQVGESVTEGVIGKWLVEPGQHVERYDPLVEVVTDKVSMEAPSPYTGVFVRALAEEGETVPMGQPICEMEVEDEGEPAGDAEDAPADDDAGRVGGAWAMPAAQGADAQGAEVPESGQGEEAGHHTFEFMDSVRSVGPTGSGERGEGRPDALQEQALAEREHEAAAPSVAEPDRSHVISPLVARLSAQYGIDLSTVRGTGTGGRITSKDLLEAVSRMTSGAQEEEAEEHLSLEGRGRAESAGEGEPEAAEAAAEAGPVEGSEASEEEAEDVEEEASEQPLFEEEAAPEEAADEQVVEEEPVEAVAEEAEEPAEDAAAAVEESPVVPAEAGTSQPTEPEPAEEDTSVMPLTPVRRIIAEHMARSSREIPAAWSMVEVDVSRLVRTRDALKAAFETQHGVPLTYLPFAAAAVAAALREHPRLNARWDDGHITLNNRVNLAVAVATEAGLMVPVLRDADTLTIAGIAAELRRLSDGARAGTLGIEDVQGGTFTLNNTGALGSVVSVPIINHPQAAIMTTEAIVKRPVVVEGDAIAVRSMMNLCLTFDHRVCDGAEAAAFLSAVKARLEVIDESIGLG
ncbi:MAG: 2-oxo acid dehydrogenase subunit E2 [Chloroflexi bacterium]|nr:2-oxo acid dehydrogenase subunit E2 [Chloroflexota bacterium]